MNCFRKNIIYLSISFFACFGAIEAKHIYGNLTVKTLDRVHDGDTFIVDIEGVHPVIGKEISIRINGIDCPEITDTRPLVKELAIRARDYAALLLQNAKKIELVNIQRDKYFRLLAEVYLDGMNLGDELIRAGFAQPYDGHKKPEW